MPGNEPEELPIFTHWVQFLEWLLPATERFPKRVRFTFSEYSSSARRAPYTDCAPVHQVCPTPSCLRRQLPDKKPLAPGVW